MVDGDGWLPVFPSDWECPVCGQLNTEADQVCVDCGLPRATPDQAG